MADCLCVKPSPRPAGLDAATHQDRHPVLNQAGEAFGEVSLVQSRPSTRPLEGPDLARIIAAWQTVQPSEQIRSTTRSTSLSVSPPESTPTTDAGRKIFCVFPGNPINSVSWQPP